MSDRYQIVFDRLAANKEGAFVPFVTLCDPDLDRSLAIVKTLINAGADALELGFPFSDPIADGPVIQAANIRALANHATVAQCLTLISKVREFAPNIPIGLLLYSNLVLRRGIPEFYQSAKQAGVDSVLIADVPIRESQPFREHAAQHGIAPIFIAAPNSPASTLEKVAHYSQGYTYLLSRAGVTGTDTAAEMPTTDIIDRLNEYQSPPPLLGFGISQPSHVKQALAAGAKGVICGSAIVKIIEQNLADDEKMHQQLSAFVQQMKAATL